MMVLVDTPVWSLALRRRREDLSAEEQSATNALADLIRDGRAQIAAPIRQELLSGMPQAERFRKLRDYCARLRNLLLKAKISKKRPL